MADSINKEVIISITLNPSDLEKNGEAMSKSLRKVKAEADELNKKLKDKNTGQAERDKIITQLDELERQQKAWKKSIAENNKEIEYQTKLSKSQEGSNDQLRLVLKKLTEQYNALGKEERENSVEGQKLATTIKSVSDELKVNESAVGDNRRNVGNYKGALEEVLSPLLQKREALIAETEALKQNAKQQEETGRKTVGFGAGIKNINASTEGVNNFNASLDGTASSMDAVNQQIIANETAIANLDQEIKQTSIGFLNADGSIKGTTTSSVKYENTLEGMTQKLRDLKELAPTLDLNSEEFKKTNDEIRATQFEIDRATGKVDEFGNKEPKNLVKKSYDDLADAAGGVTGAITLVEIAFGRSNSTAEAQAKLLQLMAIQQSVVNVAKSVGAVQDLKQLAIDKLKFLSMKNFTAASIAQAEATGTMSIAQKIYANVVGKSTGAMKTFKVALAGTGIGAIVLLLGELIFNFDGVVKVVNKVTNGFDDFTTKISGGSKILKTLFTAIGIFLSGPIAPLILLIKLINDFEGTIKGLQNYVLGLGNEIKSLTSNIPILGNVIGFLVNQAEAAVKTFNKLATSIGLMGNKKFVADLELLNTVYERFAYNLEQSQIQQKNQIELLKLQGNQSKKVAELERDLLYKNLKAQQEAFDYAETVRKKSKKSVEGLTEAESKAYNDRKNALIQAQFEIDKFEQEQINKARERAKERKGIIEDLNSEIQKLNNSFIKDQFERRRAELNQEFEDEKLATENRIKELKNEGLLTEDIERQLGERLFLLKIKLSKDLREVDQDELKYKEQLQKEAEELAKEGAQYDLDLQLELLQKQFKLEEQYQGLTEKSIALNNKESLEEQKKNQEQKLKNVVDFYTKALDLAKQLALADGIINEEEKQKIDELATGLQNAEIKLKQFQKSASEGLIPKDFVEKFQEISNEISGVLTTLSDGVNAAFESATAQIEAQGQAQVKAIENTTLTEKQKAAQIEKLNEETAKKKYQLEVDAFNFNKGIQIAQAVISGAEALIANFAVPDPSLGIVSGIRAGIIIATTATQVGIIAGQQPPPPPFYEGGYTGDGDPRAESRALGSKDYIYHKGEYVVPNKILKTDTGSKLVARLESMRLGKVSNLGLSGFADGGFTANAIRSGVEAQVSAALLAGEVATALSKVTIVTKVTDINRVNKNLANNKIAATLR